MAVGWRSSDTLLVLGSFVLPMWSAFLSFTTYDSVRVGEFSSIEIDWTIWAIVGLLISTDKARMLLCDQLRMTRQVTTGWREWLLGLWILSGAFGYVFVFALYFAIGIFAGQVPPTPESASPVYGVPTQFISGGMLMLVQAMLISIVTIGWICHRRLTEDSLE